jgi:hypothetical protein
MGCPYYASYSLSLAWEHMFIDVCCLITVKCHEKNFQSSVRPLPLITSGIVWHKIL